jgi:hypothetical protein
LTSTGLPWLVLEPDRQQQRRQAGQAGRAEPQVGANPLLQPELDAQHQPGRHRQRDHGEEHRGRRSGLGHRLAIADVVDPLPGNQRIGRGQHRQHNHRNPRHCPVGRGNLALELGPVAAPGAVRHRGQRAVADAEIGEREQRGKRAQRHPHPIALGPEEMQRQRHRRQRGEDRDPPGKGRGQRGQGDGTVPGLGAPGFGFAVLGPAQRRRQRAKPPRQSACRGAAQGRASAKPDHRVGTGASPE